MILMWGAFIAWLKKATIKKGRQEMFSDATEELEDKVPNSKFTGIKITLPWPGDDPKDSD